MALEFGVVVPTWGAFGDAQKIRQLILRAEALGYASVWVGDHLLLPDYAIDLSPANWYEALSCCLVGLGMTQRIRFGKTIGGVLGIIALGLFASDWPGLIPWTDQGYARRELQIRTRRPPRG